MHDSEKPPMEAVSSDVGVLTLGASEIRLWDLPFTVGRSSKNTLTIRDPHLSRTHARIDRCPEGYEVTNLSSRNAVRINGKPIETSFLLRSGDEIQINTHVFTFRIGDPDLEDSVDDIPAKRVSRTAVTPPPPNVDEPETLVQPPPSKAEKPRPVVSETPVADRKPKTPVARPISTMARRIKTSGGSLGRALGVGDGSFTGLAVGVILLIGMLGMAALMLSANNDAANAELTALQSLSKEVSELRKEVAQTRTVYQEQAEKNQQTLNGKKLAMATGPQRVRETKPRTRSGKPVASVVTGGNGNRGIPEENPDGQVRRGAEATGKEDPNGDEGLAPDRNDPEPDQNDPEIDTNDPEPKRGSVVKDPDPPQEDPPGKSIEPPTFFGKELDKKHLVFVLDKSSTMKTRMQQVRDEMDSVLGRMSEKDGYKFSVIFFDGQNRYFSQQLVPANDRFKGLAKRFIAMQEGKGATDPIPALQAALQIPKTEGIVFMTDGIISDKVYKYLINFLKNVTSGRIKGAKVKLYFINLLKDEIAARKASGNPLPTQLKKQYERVKEIEDLSEKQNF